MALDTDKDADGVMSDASAGEHGVDRGEAVADPRPDAADPKSVDPTSDETPSPAAMLAATCAEVVSLHEYGVVHFPQIARCAVSGIHKALGYRNVLYAKKVGPSQYRALAGVGDAEVLARDRLSVTAGDGSSLLDAVVLKGVGVRLEDLADPRLEGRLPAWITRKFAGALSLLLAPVMAQGDCIGFVYCDRDKPEPETSTDESAALLDLLQALGQAAPAR